MPQPFLAIGGLVILTMALHALVSGKVMAGSRGFKAHYYYRQDQPFRYYSFLSIYVLAGSFVLFQTL